MSPFPYLPMMAIMATLVTDMVVQMNVVSYAGFMVESLGTVDDKDKAGETFTLLIVETFMTSARFEGCFPVFVRWAQQGGSLIPFDLSNRTRAREPAQYIDYTLNLMSPRCFFVVGRILRWYDFYRIYDWPLGHLALLGSGVRPIRVSFCYGFRTVCDCGNVLSLRMFAYIRVGSWSKVGTDHLNILRVILSIVFWCVSLL